LEIATGGQAALSVTQIEWAKEAGQAPASHNSEEDLRFLNQETQWNLCELATMVCLDLTNLQPTNLSVLITRDVHSCDFVTEMMAWASAPSATLNSSSA
jgi:hypothetical protein